MDAEGALAMWEIDCANDLSCHLVGIGISWLQTCQPLERLVGDACIGAILVLCSNVAVCGFP